MGKKHSKVWLSGQGEEGQPGPLLLSAPSLHRSWDSPEPCTHTSLPSPMAPYQQPWSREVPAAWEQPDPHPRRGQPPSPRRGSAQPTPGAGKPLRTRGNSEPPSRRLARICTSSMTTPLPLVLPTGCDLHHQFPPNAGGHVGSRRFDTRPTPLRGHTTTLHMCFCRGKPCPSPPRACRGGVHDALKGSKSTPRSAQV